MRRHPRDCNGSKLRSISPSQSRRLVCMAFRSAWAPHSVLPASCNGLNEAIQLTVQRRIMSLYDGLDTYIEESRPRFESWLGRWVEVPTVSMDPARRDDGRAGASV